MSTYDEACASIRVLRDYLAPGEDVTVLCALDGIRAARSGVVDRHLRSGRVRVWVQRTGGRPPALIVTDRANVTAARLTNLERLMREIEDYTTPHEGMTA